MGAREGEKEWMVWLMDDGWLKKMLKDAYNNEWRMRTEGKN